MSPKNNIKVVTRKPNKKAGNTAIGNMMDDAPLFAGLDDFILEPKVKIIVEESGEVDKVKKKKGRGASQKTKQKISALPHPQQTQKVQQKAVEIDANSMLLSVNEMCALLKISRATLVRMDKSGQLPGRMKLGGSVRFHRETVEAWLLSLISRADAS